MARLSLGSEGAIHIPRKKTPPQAFRHVERGANKLILNAQDTIDAMGSQGDREASYAINFLTTELRD